jgi:hypothetical protein
MDIFEAGFLIIAPVALALESAARERGRAHGEALRDLIHAHHQISGKVVGRKRPLTFRAQAISYNRLHGYLDKSCLLN